MKPSNAASTLGKLSVKKHPRTSEKMRQLSNLRWKKHKKKKHNPNVPSNENKENI